MRVHTSALWAACVLLAAVGAAMHTPPVYTGAAGAGGMGAPPQDDEFAAFLDTVVQDSVAGAMGYADGPPAQTDLFDSDYHAFLTELLAVDDDDDTTATATTRSAASHAELARKDDMPHSKSFRDNQDPDQPPAYEGKGDDAPDKGKVAYYGPNYKKTEWEEWKDLGYWKGWRKELQTHKYEKEKGGDVYDQYKTAQWDDRETKNTPRAPPEWSWDEYWSEFCKNMCKNQAERIALLETDERGDDGDITSHGYIQGMQRDPVDQWLGKDGEVVGGGQTRDIEDVLENDHTRYYDPAEIGRGPSHNAMPTIQAFGMDPLPMDDKFNVWPSWCRLHCDK